jgi:class 3 adenylate cyclase/tetratricopeptide (TPR) repeat protein
VTENITVLFTDLVGSTELASSLTPDAGDEIRRAHFASLRQAIAETGGTEVKNLGDGIMVVFTTASAALGCAVGMQQAIERDNHDAGRMLGLRVGLSVGEATREDDDYFGDPVIEAARLCARAEGGQILAADAVRFMAGRRNRNECRSVGPLDLKGLPEPLEAVEVLWEPLGRAESGPTIPLPGRLQVRPLSGVVGRETELSVIKDATKRVMTGGGRELVLISGEAGLGKTTLVCEASRAAFERDVVVVFGHCEEDLATPYQLFAEALGQYVTHCPEDELLAHVDSYGGELARLVPRLSSRIPDLPATAAAEADTERYLLFSAVVGLLEAASRRQPIVVVLDDLQWADRGSLQLLRHLASSERPMRVLVLGTYRDSELSRSHPLLDTLAALRRLDGLTRIELRGLDDSGVIALMEAAGGQALDRAGVELAHVLYRETDGNPFFVSEVLRHLIETGAIYQDSDGRWNGERALSQGDLPDSVREVIGARVGRLGADAERALSMAAVIGRDFDLDVLARATDLDEDALLDMLDEAAAASLVRELPDTPGRYNFAHALIQHTLYEDLGPTRRARAHRVVAEALEDLCAGRPGARVGELARHWFHASQPIDLARAIDYSRQAADAAMDALAPADAIDYFTQALDLVAQAGDGAIDIAIDLATGLGAAQLQTGDPAFRETLLSAARQAITLGDTGRLVAAALANDRGFATVVGRVDTEKVEILETALDRLPGAGRERALILATLCTELTYGADFERRCALADEAFALASSCGDDAAAILVVAHITGSMASPSMFAQRQAWALDGWNRAERLGDPSLLLQMTLTRQASGFIVGDLEQVDDCVKATTSLLQRVNDPSAGWVIASQRVVRALVSGDVDVADERANDALRIGTDGGEPDADVWHAAQLIAVAWMRGAMAEFIPLLSQVAEDNPGIPAFTAYLAMAYAEGDHFDDAERLLDAFGASGLRMPEDSAWMSGMVEYAEAAIECRSTGLAKMLYEVLIPYPEQFAFNGVTNEGPASHYLGGLAAVLGRFDDAEAHFAVAAEQSDRAGARFFAARTDLHWGRMLLEAPDQGDLARARALLTRAHTSASEHGYGTVERRSAALLARLDA